MAARRTAKTIADLFSTSSVYAPRKPPAVVPDIPAEASKARHLLPKNLPGALAHLETAEIDSLPAAVIGEARRRDRLPQSLKKASLSSDMPTKKTPEKVLGSRSRQSDAVEREALLKQGQINAVRAAFKAGVKPSTIARKFGIPQSLVRKAIASGAQSNKS
jgi:hypothetical protein